MKYVYVKSHVGSNAPKLYNIKIGYWKNYGDIAYPNPIDTIPTDFSEKECNQFVQLYNSLLKSKLKDEIFYKGFSRCRFCGEKNGSSEHKGIFRKGRIVFNIRIPTGYLHYITEHKLRPPVQFFQHLEKGNLEKCIPLLMPITETADYSGSIHNPKVVKLETPEYTVF